MTALSQPPDPAGRTASSPTPSRAKIQDVARLAGVSLGTVSAVLNSKQVVSEATRARVLAAMAALHYQPDHHASNLVRRKTNLLGLLVSDLLNPFFAETAQMIEQEARAHGFAVTLAATNFSPFLLREAARRMLGARIAGLAVMTSEYDEEAFAMIRDSGIPSVFLDAGRPGAASTNIEVDSRGGMMAAVEHLVRLGHRDLLLLRGAGQANGPFLLSHQFRDEGFVAALEACGLGSGRARIEQAYGFAPEAGSRAVEAALYAAPFTAVICATDLLALGVYRGLHRRGVRVPQDVSVVGFDNTYLSEYLIPALTSVDISRKDLARMAIGSLLALDGRPAPSTLRLGTTVLVRESTAPPAAAAGRPASC